VTLNDQSSIAGNAGRGIFLFESVATLNAQGSVVDNTMPA